MGKVRVDVTNIIKPAGVEKLGTATANICEQGQLYQGARPSDYGQRMPTGESEYRCPAGRGEYVIGHDCLIELEHLYSLRVKSRKPKRKKIGSLVQKRGVKVYDNVGGER